jgi:D-alanyl-D-alanine carboxypeptidase (penicillin-binding protein 5/6)
MRGQKERRNWAWKGFIPLALALLMVASMLSMPRLAMCAEKPAAKKTDVKPTPPKKRAQDAQPKKGAAAEAPQGPKGVGIDASPGQIEAKSAIMIEVSTGASLLEMNQDEVIEPASFTKVLTLYLIFESLQQGKARLSDEVWIGEAAWRTGGSKMFIGLGSKVPMEELIKGITVVSGNDACVAAAEHLYGSTETFVNAMNRKAKELGMNQSHFLNPHGLPAQGQVTTARDMATLGAAYIRRFPEALRYHSMREYTYNNITQYNRNHLLLKDPSVDGLKTGFVEAAGYHLSATAQRDGMRLLTVVMGAATPRIREREALKLLNFGFRHYALVQPFTQGQPITSARVWKGVKDEVGLYPLETLSFLIPQSQRAALRWEVRPWQEVTAPVAENQPMGDVVFLVSDAPKRTIPLISKEGIELAGWPKRFWHSILQIHTVDWRWLLGILGFLLFVAASALLVMNRNSIFKRSRSPYGR